MAANQVIDTSTWPWSSGAAFVFPPREDTATTSYIYVSTTGADSNPGTLGSPVKTLAQAKTLVAAAIAGGMTKNMVVYLREGRYAITSALAFGANDSGRDGKTITWCSYPGESAIISGGTEVTGWTVHSGQIYKATVGAVNFRQMFTNGVSVERARSANADGWTRTATGYVSTVDMSAWGNPTDIEIVTRNSWTSYRGKVASIAGTAVTMSDPFWTYQEAIRSAYGIPAYPNWVENAYELLTSGHWYLNRSTGVLYYWIESGSPATRTVIVPIAEALLDISGASNLHFTNLTFSHTTWNAIDDTTGYVGLQSGYSWVDTPTPADSTGARPMPGAITISGSTNITVDQVTFSQLGTRAMLIRGGNNGITVHYNYATQNAAGFIQVGEIATAGATRERGVSVKYNYLAASNDLLFPEAGGIFAPAGDGVAIENNTVINPGWSGIALGWGWSTTAFSTGGTIRRNHIRGACQSYNDGAGIYTLGALSAAGSYATGPKIERNFVDTSYPRASDAPKALYPDDSSSWSEWTENVSQNNPWFIHIWTSRCNNLKFQGNFSDSPAEITNNGTNTTITGTVTITSGEQPAGSAARTVIDEAGVPKGTVVGALKNSFIVV